MKILIVNISDIEGGASRAAYRLHKALLSQNIESKMLVAHKYGDDFSVKGVNTSKKQKGLNLLRPTIDNLLVTRYKKRTGRAFSPALIGFSEVIEAINQEKADIVHLHWICAAMIKLEDLKKIEAPIVWSLHDMWAFTGGCHYDDNCGRYLQECGACKVLGSQKENDLSRQIYLRKKKVFSTIENMTIVGLSRWMYKSAKSSSLLKGKKHIQLPNPIDTTLFKPFDKEKSRELWSLPKNKKLVLFGAMGATSDPRKGYKELMEALNYLDGDSNIALVVLGSSKPKIAQNFGFETYYMGRLHDDVSLITLYSAVDVVVVPSLQENLSNVIMESLSCGTPVVGFNIGGNGDMIDHQITGYLANAFDSKMLAEGIAWTLKDEFQKILSENARKKALMEFDEEVVTQRYIKLYHEVLNG
jgi:glycosyltransferase involved in cell wall biosynthesis